MIHIAIIDDMAADRARLRQQLETELTLRRLEYQLTEFDSGEAFLSTFTPGTYAAVFLDIYMNGINGLEVGKQLYQLDPLCHIVFLTSSLEHTLDSYTVRATYYLVKPFDNDRLRQALDFCFPAPDPADTLVVHTKDGIFFVNRSEILYIEYLLRRGYVHLVDRVLESTSTFSELTAPLLDDSRFVICSRGLMIQMGHVREQLKNEFIMNDGRRLPISRRNRPEVLKTFTDFALKAMLGGNS